MKGSRVISASPAKRDYLLWLRHRLSSPSFILDEGKLPEFLFPEEIDAKEHIPRDILDKEHVTLFYPGCGLDVVQPLLYLSRIASGSKSLHMLLADRSMSAESMASIVMRITGNHNYSVSRKKDCSVVTFRFRDMRIKMTCVETDVLARLPDVLTEGYDVYFERAFEICREGDPFFVREALSYLNRQGVVITDAGLDDASKEGLIRIGLDHEVKELGFYKNLEMYKKQGWDARIGSKDKKR